MDTELQELTAEEQETIACALGIAAVGVGQDLREAKPGERWEIAKHLGELRFIRRRIRDAKSVKLEIQT